MTFIPIQPFKPRPVTLLPVTFETLADFYPDLLTDEVMEQYQAGVRIWVMEEPWVFSGLPFRIVSHHAPVVRG